MAKPTVTLEGKQLVIRIDVNDPPTRSASGKSLVVASTNGNIPTDIEVAGKTVTLGLNAYIKA
jgi:hypothetical protein